MPRKLSDADVTDLRRSAAAGASPAEIAQAFGVSRQHVSRLVLEQQRVTAGRSVRGPITEATEVFLASVEPDSRSLVLASVVRGLAAKLDGLGESDSAAAAMAAERLTA